MVYDKSTTDFKGELSGTNGSLQTIAVCYLFLKEENFDAFNVNSCLIL